MCFYNKESPENGRTNCPNVVIFHTMQLRQWATSNTWFL